MNVSSDRQKGWNHRQLQYQRNQKKIRNVEYKIQYRKVIVTIDDDNNVKVRRIN